MRKGGALYQCHFHKKRPGHKAHNCKMPYSKQAPQQEGKLVKSACQGHKDTTQEGYSVAPATRPLFSLYWSEVICVNQAFDQ